MRFLRDSSIKARQIRIIMLTTTAALMLAGAGFLTYELFAFRQDMARNLASLAGAIASGSTGALTFQDRGQAEQLLETLLSNEPNIVAACVYDENGETFAVYHRDSASEFTVPPVQSDAHEFRDQRLHIFRPVTLREDTAGEAAIGTVYLESDLRAMHARLQRYGVIVAGVLLLSLLVAFVLSSHLQRLVSGPILHLVEVAGKISAGKNYEVRAAKTADDELGNLTDSFNAMLAQIQERDAQLQNAHDQLERRVEERTRELQLEVQERTRAEQALQQQFKRISLLNQIARAVSDRQDLKSIALVVLRQLEDHLCIQFGAVFIFNAGQNCLEPSLLRLNGKPHDASALLGGQPIALEEAGLRECAGGRIVHAEDLSSSRHKLFQKLHDAGIGSMVSAPLLIEHGLFGILLIGRAQPGAFSDEDCEFLQTLGEHVALAAHQAHLYSELQEAYDELRQTQQTVMRQERLRALGKMASGIAHDINNAVSPVVVYSELLIRRETSLDEASKKYLRHILTAGEDIAQIVARMRDFYRAREHNEPLTRIDLNRLVGQVVDLTRPRWKDIPQERGVVIDLQTSLAAGLPLIFGNETEIREALTNVILNAVDAMPAGGSLTVRSFPAALRSLNASQHAILEVRDTGIGMDEQTRARCLEPFFTTKGQRGTGLGLAMVYGIMERHEAGIEIDSAPGKGTLIRLIFPSGGESPPLPLPSGQDAPAVKPLRILCIDDEPLLRQLLSEMLSLEGHTIVTAEGGRQGIDLFRSASAAGEPFDVVVTDLGMPYVDGRQVTATVKRESPATPVVMLTGWGAMIKSGGTLSAPVDALLSKPPRLNELRETFLRLTSA